jgi:hypothetical protein
MKYILLLLLVATSTRAQDVVDNTSTDDPFEVVIVDSQRLAPEDICAIINDTLDQVSLDHGIMLIPGGEAETRLVIRRDGAWIAFDIPYVRRSVELELVDIDGAGSRELVVHGTAGLYGSGGGTTFSGISIYRIDTVVTRLVEATDGLSEEAFAREYNRAPKDLRSCHREIAILHRQLRISGVESAVRRDRCVELSNIRPGAYEFREGRFVRVGPLPK